MAALELKIHMDITYILSIIMCKLQNSQKLYPIIPLLINKNT